MFYAHRSPECQTDKGRGAEELFHAAQREESKPNFLRRRVGQNVEMRNHDSRFTALPKNNNIQNIEKQYQDKVRQSS